MTLKQKRRHINALGIENRRTVTVYKTQVYKCYQI